MKIFNYVFTAIFLSFAGLQYNDPDALLWIAIYLAMVAFCILASMQRYYLKFTLFLVIIYVGYAAILSPSLITWFQSSDRSLLFDDLAKMQFPFIEESRELLGLMICLVVVGLNYVLKKKL